LIGGVIIKYGLYKPQRLPLDEIRQIPIEEIYNTYVGGELKKRGRQWWARCDWHGNDSSPSFKIYPDQHKWWCYGCGNGGTAIDLVMKAMQCDFKTAAMTIAKDFNITTELNYQARKKLSEVRKQNDIKKLFEINFKSILNRLININRHLYSSSRNIKICIRYPEIFMWILKIEVVLDDMLSPIETEKIEGWRQAKKVITWMEKQSNFSALMKSQI
jgi:hypothetical protein